MSELEITLLLLAFFLLMVWAMVLGVKSAKLKKTGSTLVVVAMFGFAKLLNPRQVDIEEARGMTPRKRGGENGSHTGKPLY